MGDAEEFCRQDPLQGPRSIQEPNTATKLLPSAENKLGERVTAYPIFVNIRELELKTLCGLIIYAALPRHFFTFISVGFVDGFPSLRRPSVTAPKCFKSGREKLIAFHRFTTID